MFWSGTEEEGRFACLVVPLAIGGEEFPKEFCIFAIDLREKLLYSYNAKDSHNFAVGFEQFRQLNIAGFVTQPTSVYWALQKLDFQSLAKTLQSKLFQDFEHRIWSFSGRSIHNTLNIYLYLL